MAERRSGLGSSGIQRARQNLGGALQGGDTLERAIFGQNRNAPTIQQTTEWFYPDSSRVEAYQYDYGTAQLRVKFVKYGTPWVYNDVPVEIFNSFHTSPSKGMYINSTLNYMDHRRADSYEESTYFKGV